MISFQTVLFFILSAFFFRASDKLNNQKRGKNGLLIKFFFECLQSVLYGPAPQDKLTSFFFVLLDEFINCASQILDQIYATTAKK